MPIFKSGITFFAPGKEFIITLGTDTLFLGKDADALKYPKTFGISVEYSYFDKTTVSESTQINLEEYMRTRAYPNELAKAVRDAGEVLGKSLSLIAKSAEKLSKLEELSSPTGLDLSQGTLYQIAELLTKDSNKIRFDINRATLKELVHLLGIDGSVAEEIIERRDEARYFKSFDDLKEITGMTEAMLHKIKTQTFISDPYY
jgi:competence ComEA-like helix-hairpin-helix protein